MIPFVQESRNNRFFVVFLVWGFFGFLVSCFQESQKNSYFGSFCFFFGFSGLQVLVSVILFFLVEK